MEFVKAIKVGHRREVEGKEGKTGSRRVGKKPPSLRNRPTGSPRDSFQTEGNSWEEKKISSKLRRRKPKAAYEILAGEGEPYFY